MYLILLIALILCFPGIRVEAEDLNSTLNNINFDGLRLPQTVWPRHYDFTIKTYVPGYDAVIEKDKEFTFEATVRMKIFVQSETDTIILNAEDFLYFQENCYVRTEQNKIIRIKSIVKSTNEKVAFNLESTIPVGLAEIVIEYNGKILNKGLGIYQTKYNTTDNIVKLGIATQFETMYARWMVPCFDEPLFKARWTVTIIHPKGTTALSNQIEIGKPDVMDDFLITKFKKTVPMSTYLLAISVSSVKFVEGFTRTGVRLRVWVEPSRLPYVTYALQAGLRCLEGMEKLYDEPYPMEKIDITGIKPMVNNGGMENYGLITIVESQLVYKDGDSYDSKMAVATLIAHEIAHMWFGNLVTMKWWDNVWLHEGFASFAEIDGKKLISNGIWDGEDATLEFMNKVFKEHNYKNTMPLIPNSNITRKEIEDLFGYVYSKGGATLFMLKYLIGKDFDLAVRRYLKTNKYKNVDYRELVNELKHVIPSNLVGPRNETPLNLGEFAERWLKQPGYPTLFVEQINGTSVRVTQYNAFGYKWDIPVYVQEKNQKHLAWLPFDKSLVITQHSYNALVLNHDSYVIARVNYAESGWKKIFEQLKEDHTVYSDRTKYRLIMDAFDLSGISRQRLVDALTPYLIKEKAYLPWLAIANYLRFDIKLSQELIHVLHKEPLPKSFPDDAYLENRVKDQQRTIYCRVHGCSHRRSLPITGGSKFKRH